MYGYHKAIAILALLLPSVLMAQQGGTVQGPLPTPAIGRIVTGTTDTIGAITAQDCFLQPVHIRNTGGSGVTETVPTATSLGNPTCDILIVNENVPAANVTVTFTGWSTIMPTGTVSSFALGQGQQLRLTPDPAGGAWDGFPSGLAIGNVTSGLLVNGNCVQASSPSNIVDSGLPCALALNIPSIFYVCPSNQTTCEYNGDVGSVATPSDSNACVSPAVPCATDAGAKAKLLTNISFSAPPRIQHADTTGPNVAVANTCYAPAYLEFSGSTAGNADRGIFSSGMIGDANGDFYPIAYIDIAGNLQPTLMGVGTNGLETQTGTGSVVQNSGTVTWVSGFMGAGVVPANQFQMGHTLNGVKIVINGTTHTISGDIPFGGATMTVTPVVADATGTYNATIAQRYFSGYVMPNNQVYPNGLTFIPAGSVVLDVSATDYLYWPGSGTALLVTTTLGTANAAGNALIGTITTNGSRVATAFTPNLVVLMNSSASCTGTTGTANNAFRFLNTNARVRGFTANYYDATGIYANNGGASPAWVECYGGSSDCYIENIISTMTGAFNGRIVISGEGARAHLGGNIQANGAGVWFGDFLGYGETKTPMGTQNGYLVMTRTSNGNASSVFDANVMSSFIGWGPFVMNFLGSVTDDAFHAQDAGHIDMISNLNFSSYMMFNNANLRLYGGGQNGQILNSCGAAGLYCSFTSWKQQVSVTAGAYAQDFAVHAGTTADSVTSGAKAVFTGTTPPIVESADIFYASLVTTAATSDNVTISGVTSSSHCNLTPTNTAAATNITTTFISAKTTNQITVTHTATANMNYDIVCGVN